MTRTIASQALLLGALLQGALACGSTVTVQKAACVDDESCMSGEHCVAGLCQAALEEESCANDAECDIAAGELCVQGTCTAPPSATPDSCAETRDCPVTDFCNTASGQCEPLRAGFCRLDGQCPDGAPMCDTPTPAQPGRCVQCLEDADCDGGVCAQGGSCVGGGETVDCPDHASLVPGSTTVCQCDPGYIPDVATSTCIAQPGTDPGTDPGQGDPPPDTSTCVPNASPVPGIPGQCRCDSGFEPSTDGSSCVPVAGSTPPPPPPPPPPDSGGGGGGGGGGGDTGGDDSSCGPNAIPIFFLCMCLPGYVVSPSGYGCVMESSSGGGGGGDGCPANSTLESDGYCYCDPGYVVDASQTQCEPEGGGGGYDECAELGYYGDGYYCDDFCPEPDPDCY
ncbi:MAG: hypothetical protein IT382_20535 [Deltaproteobacteria bacterium]|nr:hypothetical protein [Deltaproteobacteria bacterium]